MGFEQALIFVKMGQRAQRMGWNGKDMWIQVQLPDASSKMTLPYIVLKTAQDDLVPWQPSQTDMLSHDWQVLMDDGTVATAAGKPLAP